MDVTLARNLLARRRLYAWSVATGFVGALFVISAALEPETLTPTTTGAVRATAAAYFPGRPWPLAAGLVVFLYQGPYLLGLFGSILGFAFASVLLHGWQFGSVSSAGDFEHDASTETVAAILGAVAVHGVVLTAAAYLPATLYFVAEARLFNPFGAWAALGPAIVVGCTVAAGLAVALVGVLGGGASKTGVALFAFVPAFAGMQYAHFAPTRPLRVGLLGVGAVLAAFCGAGWRALARRTD